MKEVTLAERVKLLEEYIKEKDGVTAVETETGVRFVTKSPGNCKRIGNCPDNFCPHRAWCVDCPAWEYREPKVVEGNSGCRGDKGEQ